MAAKKKKRAATKKRATKKRAAPRRKSSARRKSSRKSSRTKSTRKAPMGEAKLASTFSRAVSAGSVGMARKLASALKRHSAYGVYSAPGVSPQTLRAFEQMGKRKKR